MKKYIRNFKRSNKSIVDVMRIVKYRYRKISNKDYIKYERNINYNMQSIVENISINNIINSDDLLMSEANKILENNYRQINGESKYIPFINWEYDYLLEKKLPNRDIKDLKTLHNTLDLKNIWEMSKLHWLLIVAISYRKSSEDKYLNFTTKMVKKWIKENKDNINWTSPMEVSIRLVNLIEIFNIIKPSLSRNDQEIITSSIIEHINFIYNHLEKGLISNNHYISNLVALGWAALFMESSNNDNYIRKGGKVKRFVEKQLKLELNNQIYNDGMFYEDSFNYHMFNSEMLYSLDLIYKTNDTKTIVDELILKKIMTPIVNLYNQKTNFNFGDVDNSRLLIIESKTYRDHLNYESFLNVINNTFNIKKNELKWFKESGLISTSCDNFNIILKCGNIGMLGHGGHSHNDQMHLTLSYMEMPLFIDNGTGVYTSSYSLRDEYRSINKHNTINIEGEETNQFKGVFSVEQDSIFKLNFNGENKIYASHNAYRERYGVDLNREIRWGNNIKIIDHIIGVIDLDKYNVSSHFYIPLDVKLNTLDKNTIIITMKNNDKLKFTIVGGALSISKSKSSNSYFNFVEVHLLKVRFVNSNVSYLLEKVTD